MNKFKGELKSLLRATITLFKLKGKINSWDLNEHRKFLKRKLPFKYSVSFDLSLNQDRLATLSPSYRIETKAENKKSPKKIFLFLLYDSGRVTRDLLILNNVCVNRWIWPVSD